MHELFLEYLVSNSFFEELVYLRIVSRQIPAYYKYL